jgi:hypothetical protein
LSTIRNLVELVEQDAQGVLDRVLPLVQENLTRDAVNLDLHCEAVVVYKNLAKEPKIVKVCPYVVSFHFD